MKPVHPTVRLALMRSCRAVQACHKSVVGLKQQRARLLEMVQQLTKHRLVNPHLLRHVEPAEYSDDDLCDAPFEDDKDEEIPSDAVATDKPGMVIEAVEGKPTRLLFPDAMPGRVFVPPAVWQTAKDAGTRVMEQKQAEGRSRGGLLGAGMFACVDVITRHFGEGIRGEIIYGTPKHKVTMKWEDGDSFDDWVLAQPEPVATALRKTAVFFRKHIALCNRQQLKEAIWYIIQNIRTFLQHSRTRKNTKRRRRVSEGQSTRSSKCRKAPPTSKKPIPDSEY